MILLVAIAVTCVAQIPEGAQPSTFPNLNVRSFGAKGDGKTDDTTAFVKALAFAARCRRQLYVPAGVYPVLRLRLPKGVHLKGAASSTTWLRGPVTFGSQERISDLRIGEAGGSAVHNADGASGTTFVRCRFRGGGGGWKNGSVIVLGQGADCTDILFKDCEVERNLGTEDSSFSNGFNDIAIVSGVSYITFDGCHVGVSNGVATGSPRMGLECWTEDGATSWHDITINDCIFEVMDCHGADFSDTNTSQATGVVITNNIFKGGGKRRTIYGSTVDFELCHNAVFTGNYVGRGWEYGFQMTDRGIGGFSGPNMTITGNTFDYTTDNGVTSTNPNQVGLFGSGNTFSGNTCIGFTYP